MKGGKLNLRRTANCTMHNESAPQLLIGTIHHFDVWKERGHAAVHIRYVRATIMYMSCCRGGNRGVTTEAAPCPPRQNRTELRGLEYQ